RFGRAENRLGRDGTTGSFGDGIELRPGDQLAGFLQPVVSKTGLERTHRRTLQADLDVAPVIVVLRVPHPMIGDAGPAGKRDSPVDDQRFSMRAMVEAAGVVPRELTLAFLENLENLVADGRRTDGIEKDLDDHALFRARSQRARELEA